MANDPSLQAGNLLDDCGQLLQLARLVAQDPPATPADESELRHAHACVLEALAALEPLIAIDGEEPITERQVRGIVGRLLGRRRDRGAPEPEPRPALPGPRPEEMLQGHSRTVAIPDLLSFLQMQRKTGVLRVVLPVEVISIQFEEGQLSAAVSSNSPPGCLLGEILVEQGSLHQRQLEAFLAFYTIEQGLIGTALEVHDLVSEEDLRRALTTQVQRLFHRLLASPEALFEFRDGETEERHPVTRLNVTQLLLESARHLDEAAQEQQVEEHLALTAEEEQDLFEDLRAELSARLGEEWDDLDL